MQIGPYKLSALETGEFALDGGAMFGVIPRVMWEKKIPPDEKNRIPMRMRLLLVQGEGKNILTDTGAGVKNDDKFNSIYKIDYSNFSLEKALSEHGLTTADITDVVISHLHFDHAGGATKTDKGKIVPTFENAKYYIQKSQLEWAQNPSERDRASFFKENFAPLLEAKQTVILDGFKEIYPCINVQITMGHTNNQQHLVVSDGKTTVFYLADLIPTFAHIGLPWVMGYDLRPMVTMEEKRFILKQAVRNNWILFFEHCPKITACRVKKTDKGFEVAEMITSMSKSPATKARRAGNDE